MPGFLRIIDNRVRVIDIMNCTISKLSRLWQIFCIL